MNTKEKLRVGVLGCGGFSASFVQLFKEHPYVEKVAVADLEMSRAKAFGEKFGVEYYRTLDELLETDVNCIAIFTPRHTHGPLVIQSLKAGRHVYSAVPMASEISHCEEIVRLVKETHLTYMMGETCYYYPDAIYCRQKYAEGAFGKFVYGEAQYYHDISEMYGDFKRSGGEHWQRPAGIPPMFYPTHSISMLFSSINEYATKVSCLGLRDDFHTDEIYGEGKNYWDNPFSNTSMLMKLSNDAVVRISENRRIAWGVPETYISNFHGTKASYECSLIHHSYIKIGEDGPEYEDVSDLLNPIELTKHKNEENFVEKAVQGNWASGEAPIQIFDRVPEELQSLLTDHGGTHQFMVDDFCKAAAFS